MNNNLQVMDRPTGAKLATIKYVGGNKPPETIFILPGNTTEEILFRLGLDENFHLSKGDTNAPFGFNEVIYNQVEDGQLLFVSSLVDAGIDF